MNRIRPLITIAVLLMALPAPAAAYVDPGSGTMLWQLAAAALFGGLFQIKRITGWFRRRVMPGTTVDRNADRANRDQSS